MARLRDYHRWFISLLLLSATSLISAQAPNTRLEFASLLPDGETVFHVRVLRGQTVESATLQIPSDDIALTAQPVPLDVTQWIVLDASDGMVNYQAAVTSAMQRFLRNAEGLTGIIYYDNDVRVLQPTDNASEINAFLAEYTATDGEIGCVADALNVIAQASRPIDRSWRVMLVSSAITLQTACDEQNLPTMPTPIDIISIAEGDDETLVDLVNRSGGSIVTANLRTVEARVNEIRTQWGQPTYLLSTTELDSVPIRSTLEITLANDLSESLTPRFRSYNIAMPPTPIPSETPLPATAAPDEALAQAEETAEAVAASAQATAQAQSAAQPATNAPDNTLFLILGAVLFIVGAVIAALSLSRFGRGQDATPAKRVGNAKDSSSSFYASLERTPAPVDVASEIATQIRGNDGGSGAGGATQIANEQTPTPDDTDAIAIVDPYELDDELIITQVLTDDRFKRMMEQSTEDTEIVGFMRIEGAMSGDYQLSKRGLLVGRGMGCDIQVKGDSAISRQHARIDVQPDGSVTVSRLSAVNPVVVGGNQVSNRYPLKSNDVIHLSDRTRLVFIVNKRTDDDDDTQT